jgi:hypothetical protein
MDGSAVVRDLMEERVTRRGITKRQAAISIARDVGCDLRPVWYWLAGRSMSKNILRFLSILLLLERRGSLSLADLEALN